MPTKKACAAKPARKAITEDQKRAKVALAISFIDRNLPAYGTVVQQAAVGEEWRGVPEFAIGVVPPKITDAYCHAMLVAAKFVSAYFEETP
jgi:hypothetical protein